MKKKVISLLIKDGYSETIASALTDKFWEEAERNGCRTQKAIYEFILKARRGT